MALLLALLVVAVLLAWADSTLFRPLFPQPLPEGPRRIHVAPAELPAYVAPPGKRVERFQFTGLGSVGGLYGFWWFLAAGAVGVLLCLGATVLFPARVRQAAERVRPGTLSLMLVAGIASALLILAATLLVRATFFLLPFAPLLWAAGVLGATFGIAALALAAGRLLAARFGRVHPLLGALLAILLLYDLALVPVAGWVLLALVALAALGVGAVTRLGSPRGWSLEDLHW